MGFKILSKLKNAFKSKRQPGPGAGKNVRFQEALDYAPDRSTVKMSGFFGARKPSISSRVEKPVSFSAPKAASPKNQPSSATLPSTSPRTPDRKLKAPIASAAPSIALTEIDDVAFEKLVDELSANANWFQRDLQDAFARMERKPFAIEPESMQQKLATQHSTPVQVPAFLDFAPIPVASESGTSAPSLERNAIEVARLQMKIAELELKCTDLSQHAAPESPTVEATSEAGDDSAKLDYWSTGMSDITLPLNTSFTETMDRVRFEEMEALSWDTLYDEDKAALRHTFRESYIIENAPIDLIQLSMKAQLGIADQNLGKSADALPQALLGIDPDAPNASSDAAALAWYAARAEEEIQRKQVGKDWLAPSDRLLPGLRDTIDAKVDLYLDLRGAAKSAC